MPFHFESSDCLLMDQPEAKDECPSFQKLGIKP